MKTKNLLKKIAALCLGLSMTFGAVTGISVEAQKVNAEGEIILDLTTKSYGISRYDGALSYGEWVITNGANNNQQWAYFKMGGKEATLALANPCTIRYNNKVEKEISKINVHIAAGSLSKSGMSVSSWGVYVYSDSGFTTQVDYVAGGTITSSAQDFEFKPSTGTSWAKDRYYLVSWSLANTTTTNGIVCVDKVTIFPYVSECEHDIEHHLSTATCTASGNGEYWSCSKCKNLFSDSEGKNKIDSIPTANALGHDYQYDEISNNDKFHSVKCSRCDYSTTESHSYGGPNHVDDELVSTCSICQHEKHEPYVNIVSSIEITTEPTNLNPIVGSELDLTGLVVKAHWTGQDDTTLSSSDYTISGFEKFTLGDQTITVSYNDDSSKTDTFTVTVGLKPSGQVITWNKVTAEPVSWVGEYLLAYTDNKGTVVWTGVDGGQCRVSATVSNNMISTVPNTAVSIVVAQMTGGYSIMVNGGINNGKFIGQSYYENGLSFNETALLNTLSLSNEGVDICGTGNSSNDYVSIRYNSATGTSNERFRYYKSGQYAVQLFKKTLSGDEGGDLIKVNVSYENTGNALFAGNSINTSDITVSALYNTSATPETPESFIVRKVSGDELLDSLSLNAGCTTFRVFIDSDEDNVYGEFTVSGIEERTASIEKVYLDGTPSKINYYNDGVSALAWDFTGLLVKVVWDDNVTVDTYSLAELVADERATVSPSAPSVSDDPVSFTVSCVIDGVSIDSTNGANTVTGLSVKNKELTDIKWNSPYSGFSYSVFENTSFDFDRCGTVSGTYNNGDKLSAVSVKTLIDGGQATLGLWENYSTTSQPDVIINDDFKWSIDYDHYKIALIVGNIRKARGTLFNVVESINEISKLSDQTTAKTISVSNLTDYPTSKDSSNNVEKYNGTYDGIEYESQNMYYYSTTSSFSLSFKATSGDIYLKNNTAYSTPIHSINITDKSSSADYANNYLVLSFSVDGSLWVEKDFNYSEKIISADVSEQNYKYFKISDKGNVSGRLNSGYINLSNITINLSTYSVISNNDTVAQGEALTFAKLINEESNLADNWSAFISLYSDLSAGAKLLLENASANSAGDNLQKAIYKYEQYVSYFAAEDFINRGVSLHEYTITWKDENGNTIATEKKTYGQSVSRDVPTKDSDAQYSYSYIWKDTPVACVGDATYTAVRTDTLNSYTVKWSANGSIIETDENVTYGTVASYDGAIPTKAPNATSTFTFDHWALSEGGEAVVPGSVNGDVTYFAVFTENVCENSDVTNAISENEISFEDASALFNDVSIVAGKAMATPDENGVLFIAEADDGKVIDTITLDLNGASFSIYAKTADMSGYREVQGGIFVGDIIPKKSVKKGLVNNVIDLPEGVTDLYVTTTSSAPVEVAEFKLLTKAAPIQSMEATISTDIGFKYSGSGTSAHITTGQLQFSVSKDVSEAVSYGFLVRKVEGSKALNSLTAEEVNGIVNSTSDIKKVVGKTEIAVSIPELTTQVEVVFFMIDSEGNISYGAITSTSFHEQALAYGTIASNSDANNALTNYKDSFKD